MGTNKSAARNAAIAWWKENNPPAPRCDGQGCARPLARGEGYLCKSRTFGLADLVCEQCFDKHPYEPYLAGLSDEDRERQEHIDTDPAILEHQMQEVLISFGDSDHRPQRPVPSDSEFPPSENVCDRYFYMGEACLAARQPRTAVAHLTQALSAFAGRSSYPNFRLAARLALVECLASSAIKDWDGAAKIVDELLKENPNEDRAHALRARILVRQGKHVEAYRAAMAALKSNPECLEAACYLGFIGFTLARAGRDKDWMQKDLENLETAQRIYPESFDLHRMIQQCRDQLNAL
jgi:tetratricopeptide (TPR) repeat protein